MDNTPHYIDSSAYYEVEDIRNKILSSYGPLIKKASLNLDRGLISGAVSAWFILCDVLSSEEHFVDYISYATVPLSFYLMAKASYQLSKVRKAFDSRLESILEEKRYTIVRNS